MIGISFGGAITLKLFESNDVLNNQPKTIFTYGTYNNFESALEFLISGKIIINQKEKNITPHPWGLVVMFYNYLSSINTDLDVNKIKTVLEFQINDKEDKIKQHLNTLPIKEKQITEKILNCIIDDEILKYIKSIIVVNQDLFRYLSSQDWNNKIKTKVFIFHGANDNMIPYTESVDLSKNITNSKLFISYLYEHKEISENKNFFVKFVEIIKMIKFVFSYINYNED